MKSYDCIIVGSGISAFQLAKHLDKNKQVLIITKLTKEKNNSFKAQGGIAAAMSNDDDWRLHYEDTIQAGCSFQKAQEVEALVKNGPALIQSLIDEGVPFDLNEEGDIRFGMEGAHSRKRIVHSGGDATGKNVMAHLQTTTNDNIEVIENQFVYECIMSPTSNRCIGIRSKSQEGKNYQYFAQSIVLATGGMGGLYKSTSNESSITGDGLALAYRAGAELVDLEFVQFHPTLLHVNGACKGLISEAVRGAGAVLYKGNGERLMGNEPPFFDLAPRHIVAKSIYEARTSGSEVFLDISMIQDFSTKFPTIASLCEENGISINEGAIPVIPGAHFLMGGISVNANGETTVKGLFAVGEAAATGVHGANRLASNSLLEGLYYGKKIAQYLNELSDEGAQEFIEVRTKESVEILELPTKKEIQDKMLHNCGIVRTQVQLENVSKWLEKYAVAHESLASYQTPQIERLFMLQVAKLIVTAALTREESRGAHQRADFLETSNEWQDIHMIQSKKGIEKRALYEQSQVEVNA